MIGQNFGNIQGKEWKSEKTKGKEISRPRKPHMQRNNRLEGNEKTMLLNHISFQERPRVAHKDIKAEQEGIN